MHIEYLRETGSSLPRHPMAESVLSLKIWHCKFKSLASLPEYRSLRSLEIAGFPGESFSLLRSLHYLRELRVLHLPKVNDLNALAALPDLEVLSLETLPSWDASRKRQRVASLEPIGRLARMRSLELLGVIPIAGGLEPVRSCNRLSHLKLLGYSQAERASLERELPLLAGGGSHAV